ncbi:MAG: methyltransferase domain-containing protein [Desulfobacteraceae bacterium]|nr:methyltransferase domain-containing protein [Desulfobacteraceae bacterium]
MNRKISEKSLDREYWEDAWASLKENSIIARTQKANPDAWHGFYNRVGRVYHRIWGGPGDLGNRLAGHLVAEGLACPGRSVLDLGCGPGTLTIPLARSGCRVMAVDYAPGMLATLKKRGGPGLSIAVRCARFEELEDSSAHDLVLAAFFPPVFSPEGVAAMEKLSQGCCAVVLGSGNGGLPLRDRLWSALMDSSPDSPARSHLECLTGYLNATGRRPDLKELAWEHGWEATLDDCLDFFLSYFSIFGKDSQDDRACIRKILEKEAWGGRISSPCQRKLSVVSWKPVKWDVP